MVKTRILVVDDEPGIRRYLQANLEDEGYTVLVATDGPEALKAFEMEQPDLVVLDITMPGMDGFEVCRRIREWSQTPIMMLSARGNVDDKVKCLNLGADDYITKPFDPDEVLQKVRTAIQSWRQLSQKRDSQTKLRESITEQTERMRQQFDELVMSLAREHKLLHRIAASEPGKGRDVLSELPSELRDAALSFEEFREALIRILRRS